MISCSICTPIYQVSAALKAAIKQSVRPSGFTVVADMLWKDFQSLLLHLIIFSLLIFHILSAIPAFRRKKRRQLT